MSDIQTNEITRVIEEHPEVAQGQPEQVAGRWIEAGFESPDEVAAWLEAGYADPDAAAARLDAAGGRRTRSEHGRDVVRGTTRRRSDPTED